MDKNASIYACNENVNNNNDNKPSPTNLEEYLPWACVMLQEHFFPVITKGIAPQESTTAKKGKKNELQASVAETDATDKGSSETDGDFYCKQNGVNIEMVYDSCDFLVKLKFCKNRTVPRKLLMIINLIVQFHPQLTAIIIDSGLDQNGLYELAKTVATTNITEIILDNTVFKEANYYTLLENETHLKYLSLARCKINDDALQEMASRLSFPLPASKTLSVLNLATNRITDVGAKYLGEMLKTNRQLAYLNLADNMVTDIGAESIFNILKEFPISIDEIVPTRRRKYAYLTEKRNLIQKTAEEMLSLTLSKYASKFKSSKLMTGTSTVRKHKDSRFGDLMPQKNLNSFTEVAEAAVESQLGPFKDPYSSENIVKSNDTIYCLGNNTLCYISLAYNDLTCLAVKELYTVLSTQSNLNRSPKGLVNVCIDGNDISDTCCDLERVNSIIEQGLVSAGTITVVVPTKKKGGSTK